jgi:hypothetical protein
MNHVLFVSFILLLFGVALHPKGKKKKRKHNLILYKGGKSDN